ncbi:MULTISPECIES: dTDP-4-dehydrorhamnose 3,5-epimerase [Myroides]|uniref:dTDP-4-dehydrorhamnose 3,5-epimerase n=1 Tax=Myroides albus TaxID=2562892 RepID=A0A6I3LF95_9FLAO|nr:MULTISPECIES: dTDP-4-dehydrorhamnose 3,5-epimerase [Myroides]MTG96567.1 dTDP-4-dehydrorhamnose 3,5-epimerase [Myroides albus]MVX34563.1 dTDP-4-dehydrorhamnose 3,5-epimerase [Myroides sp. LoEW2-1]UVD81019.1 dTDP-4-dehydrorhamnose 3,5-epimerase [Myroides albus]
MKIKATNIEGCFELYPTVFNDERGYFFESYNKVTFENLSGLKVDFVQDNQSFSKRGVLRGLHFQRGIYQQAKLVRVIKGEIEDVVVDIRKDSPTFGQYFKTVLSAENNKQIFVPKGCAHGFLVLSEEAFFNYKCDNYYNKESEGGILYNDVDLNIPWSISDSELIISDKDQVLPRFKDISAL